MVSAVVSGLSGPGSSPDRGHYVVFWGKTLLSPCDGLASHPGGCRNTRSHFMLKKAPAW